MSPLPLPSEFHINNQNILLPSPPPSSPSPFHLLHRRIKGSVALLGAKGMPLTGDAIIKITPPMRDDPLAPKGAVLPLLQRGRRLKGEAEGEEGGGEWSGGQEGRTNEVEEEGGVS